MEVVKNKKVKNLEWAFAYMILVLTAIKLLLNFAPVDNINSYTNFLDGIITGVIIMSVVLIPKSYLNLFKKYGWFILLILFLIICISLIII